MVRRIGVFFLLHYGFQNATSDASLFVYQNNGVIMYLLVYVDDLVLTGNNLQETASFVGKLSKRFSLKDLGQLHYFLGVEAMFTSSGLLLTQHKYIRELIDKFGMTGAKTTATPMATNHNLLLKDGTGSVDEKMFRQAIGCLQYLSLTRPDLAFSTNKLAQFMHAPTQAHWIALKRLLRYLKGTMYHGIFLHRKSSLILKAYSDSV